MSTQDSFNTWIAFLNDQITVKIGDGSATQPSLTTTPVYRDFSAWMHITVAVDTTQATASNRVKIYVNGVQVSSVTGSYPSQNFNADIDTTGIPLQIGRNRGNSSFYFPGYMSELNFIDGQALTPTSFGSTDSNGNWGPISYTGTYGTNGLHLVTRQTQEPTVPATATTSPTTTSRRPITSRTVRRIISFPPIHLTTVMCYQVEICSLLVVALICKQSPQRSFHRR